MRATLVSFQKLANVSGSKIELGTNGARISIEFDFDPGSVHKFPYAGYTKNIANQNVNEMIPSIPRYLTHEFTLK